MASVLFSDPSSAIPFSHSHIHHQDLPPSGIYDMRREDDPHVAQLHDLIYHVVDEELMEEDEVWADAVALAMLRRKRLDWHPLDALIWTVVQESGGGRGLVPARLHGASGATGDCSAHGGRHRLQRLVHQRPQNWTARAPVQRSQ